MHLKKLLRYLLISAFAAFFGSHCLFSQQEKSEPQQSSITQAASKKAFLPLKITINPNLKLTKSDIEKLRTTWHWDNASTTYQDSIQGAEPFPDDNPVMFVYLDTKLPENVLAINIYTYTAEKIESSYDLLFTLGTNIATIAPETPSFYIEQTMLNDINPTAVWVEIVLNDSSKMHSQPIFLPSLQTLGLSTMNILLDAQSPSQQQAPSSNY